MTDPARISALLDACPEPEDIEAVRAWMRDFDAAVGQRNERWMDDLSEFMNGKEVEESCTQR